MIPGQRWLVTASDPDAFGEYCRILDGAFCPFIGPAVAEALLHATIYALKPAPLERLQEEVFFLGLYHTELFRRERLSLPNPRQKALLCENLIFSLPPEHDQGGEALLSVPHWCLKTLYTRAGILFGKFWKGEQGTARDGRPIPEPPVHLLSIRSAVKPLDRRFFAKAPTLLPELEAANDTGQQLLPEGAPIPRTADEARVLVGGELYPHLRSLAMDRKGVTPSMEVLHSFPLRGA